MKKARAKLRQRVHFNELIVTAARLKRWYGLSRYEAGISAAWLAGVKQDYLDVAYRLMNQ